LAPVTSPYRPNYDPAGVRGQTYVERYTLSNTAGFPERTHALEDFESAANGPLCLVLMRSGIPEVHNNAVTEVLRYMAFFGQHRLAADLLIPGHQISEILRVKQLRQFCGPHDVAEEHGDLAAFRHGVLGLNFL